MSDENMSFKPVRPFLGSEVVGIDLSKEIPEVTAERLRSEMNTRDLLLFRNQNISAADQTRFANIFGKIEIRTNHYKGVAKPEFADQQHVSNTRADGILANGELTFHADHLWDENPLDYIILYGIECPQKGGGETLFCASGKVFEDMPKALKSQLEPLRATTMYDFRSGDYTAAYDTSRIGEPGVRERTHPIVYKDPKSGRRAIWYNGTSTVGIEGVEKDAQPELIAKLRQHIDNPAYTYAHRWQPGDLVIWSNRRLLHARTPFDSKEPRTLRRTPILAAA